MPVEQNKKTKMATVQPEPKPIWQSKTLWFNALAVLVLIAQLAGYSDFKMDPDLQTLIVTFANLALRYVTTKPVTL